MVHSLSSCPSVEIATAAADDDNVVVAAVVVVADLVSPTNITSSPSSSLSSVRSIIFDEVVMTELFAFSCSRCCGCNRNRRMGKEESKEDVAEDGDEVVGREGII